MTANSAASVYTAECQNGASAQDEDGGFSITSQDFVCDSLKMATESYKQYRMELEKCVVPVCEGVCTDSIATVELVYHCDVDNEAERYYEQYLMHMNNASEHVESRKWTARFGAWVSDLGPWALLAVVFL